MSIQLHFGGILLFYSLLFGFKIWCRFRPMWSDRVRCGN